MINQTQRTRLQKIQNQCVRLLEKGQDNLEVRKKYKILSINELTNLENYKLWYKEQHCDLPENLLKQMRINHLQRIIRKRHKYSTRIKQQMNLPVEKAMSIGIPFYSRDFGSSNYGITTLNLNRKKEHLSQNISNW